MPHTNSHVENEQSVRSQQREYSEHKASAREDAPREATPQGETKGRFRKPADELDKLARAVRFTGDRVIGPLSAPITRIATGVENAAQSLREASTQDVVNTIEGFSRRRPLAFLGVAALVGFGEGRLFKSKSTSRSAS